MRTKIIERKKKLWTLKIALKRLKSLKTRNLIKKEFFFFKNLKTWWNFKSLVKNNYFYKIQCVFKKHSNLKNFTIINKCWKKVVKNKNIKILARSIKKIPLKVTKKKVSFATQNPHINLTSDYFQTNKVKTGIRRNLRERNYNNWLINKRMKESFKK